MTNENIKKTINRLSAIYIDLENISKFMSLSENNEVEALGKYQLSLAIDIIRRTEIKLLEIAL